MGQTSVYPKCTASHHSKSVACSVSAAELEDCFASSAHARRQEDLRLARENACLVTRHVEAKKKTSQYLGVHWCKKNKKWRARIVIANRHLYLGSFPEEVTAAREYDAYARLHFGRVAKLNFPSEVYNQTYVKHTKTSKYRGVSWHKSDKSWKVSCHIEGRPTYIGGFKDEIEAARAYDKAALDAFGARARLNFPEETFA